MYRHSKPRGPLPAKLGRNPGDWQHQGERAPVDFRLFTPDPSACTDDSMMQTCCCGSCHGAVPRPCHTWTTNNTLSKGVNHNMTTTRADCTAACCTHQGLKQATKPRPGHMHRPGAQHSRGQPKGFTQARCVRHNGALCKQPDTTSCKCHNLAASAATAGAACTEPPTNVL